MSTQSIDPSDFLHPPSGLKLKVLKVVAVLLVFGSICAIVAASYEAVMALFG